MTGKWNWVIILGYVAVSLPVLIVHAPWRDEGQAWLLARDTANLGELVRMMGYEGSPGLWHLLLYPLARSGLPIFAENLLHFLIALAAVIVLVLRSPFRPLEKVFLVFGYFLLYRYSIVARSYIISILLLLVIASIYRSRFRAPLRFGALLALLANTNVHSAAIAMVFVAVYSWELIRRATTPRWAHAGFYAAALAGLAIAAFQLLPPPDLSPGLARWYFPRSVADLPKVWWAVNQALVSAFCPLSLPWATRSRLSIPELIGLRIPVALAIFIATIVVLRRGRSALLLYLGWVSALMVIFAFKFIGGTWHHGLIFIGFIVAMWIHATSGDRPDASPHDRLPPARALGLILLWQFLVAPMPIYEEVTGGLSAGRDVARYLEQEGYTGPDSCIVIYPGYMGACIIPHVRNRDFRMYYCEDGDFGTYATWHAQWLSMQNLTRDELAVEIAQQGACREHGRSLLVLRHDPDVPAGGPFAESYHRVRTFTASLSDESFDIFVRR